MDCEAFERDAVAFCRGELSPETDRAMVGHRRQCEACRSLCLALAEVLQEVGPTESAQLSPRFWPQLEERLQETDSERSRRWSGWGVVVLPRLRPVAVGACLLLGICAGAGLGASWDTAPVSRPQLEAETEQLPHLAVLDAVPHGSFAELLIEEASLGGQHP